MTKQLRNKIPQIRFRGFDEKWEEKPIGKVLTETKRSIVLEDNQRYELVTVRRRNGGVVSRGYLLGRDILVKNYSQLESGDFIISKRQVVHGATGIVPEKLNKAIVSNEYLVAVGNDKLSTEFLTILSSLPEMRQKFFLSSYGVDIEKLFFDTEDWKKRTVTIPKVSEQSQISAYYKELDRVIELHQHKHNKLLGLKQAMMQKMFPQDGATTPEIRFKGFDEDWRDTTLGEQVAITMGQSPLGCTYTGNPRDFILVQGNADMKDGYVVPRVWTTQITKMAHAGDLVLSVRAPVGDVGKTSYDIVLGRGVAGVKGNEFIYQSLKRMKMLGFWRRFSSGSTFDSINSDGIKSASLTVPCNVEQKKIGNYLRKLDDLISQHFIQIDKLKQIKSACLEKMFV